MSEDRPEPEIPLFRRTWLRRSVLALAALSLLLAVLIFSIPALVSSDWARAKVKQTLAAATGKPASLRLLSLSWSDGLRLEGLLIGRGSLEDEDFFCSLTRLHVDLGLLPALRRDLRLRVELSGLRLRQRLEGGQPEPPAEPPVKPLPQLLRDGLAALRQGLKPGPRRADAHVQMELSDIAARLILANNSTLDLRDMALRLDAPGLDNGPLRLTAGLTAFQDGHELAPVRLTAALDGLIDQAGLLAPAQARLSAQVEAPGLHLTALGSVARGFKTDLRLDLRQASAPLKPLLGAALPEVSGSLALGLTLSQPDPDHLALGLLAFADALHAAGGPLGTKAVGPLKLNLLQEADFDLQAGTVHLPGTLNLLRKSALRWQGEVSGLNQGKPTITLAVQPLHLQLDELIAAARAWLPPGLGLGAATLDAASLKLQAELPEKAGQKPNLACSIQGLVVDARNLTRSSGTERLSLALARLRLDSLEAMLPGEAQASAPGSLTASATVSMEGLRLQGKTPMSVKRSQAGLKARVDGLALNQAALFGVTGAASLDVNAEAQGIDLPGKAQVPGLTKTLALRANLPADKHISASLDALALDIPVLRVFAPGKKPLEAPLALRLSAPDIRLAGAPGSQGPLIANVTEARLTLDLGQALHCAALASMAGSDVQSSGSLGLDAQKLLALAAPLLPRQAKGSGGLALDWKLSATLPKEQGPAPKQEKLSQTIQRLGFLKELEAVLSLADLSLDWPLTGTGDTRGQPAETLRLRGLSTPRPLRAKTTGGLRESSLTGSLAFGPLSELPGIGPLEKPLRGLLTVNAAQQNARSLQFSQLLHVDGLDLDQNLRLVLDRLDLVLDRAQDRLAAVLEHMDGTLGFDLKAGLQNLPTPAAKAKGLSGTGRLEAGFDARLSGGRSLALSARLTSPGLDLRLGPEVSISGLTSSLRLDKRFALAPGLRCAASGAESLPPLSELVIDQAPASSGRSSSNDDFARASLHGFAPGGGSLGFSQLQFKSGGLPLSLRDVALRLDLSGPLPALRYFRAGLLGGNLQGSALVKSAGSGSYSLEADCAFTGIDPARLLPAKAAKDLGDQAETAGRVTLSVPLTNDPEALLQRLALRADITKIGPRTLERLLYALDPDEQNESIVQQRRLMGIGFPRLVRIGMAYGNVSLSGEVVVKGFALDLPRIDRLPVANLPIRRQLTKALAPIPAIVETLNSASAGGICRDPADPPGRLKVVRNTAPQGVAP